MKEKGNYSINSRINYLNNRNLEVSRLRNSVYHLHIDKIQEYVDTIIKSYEESTVVHKIAKYQKEQVIKSRGFRSIGLYQAIKKDDFYAKNYYWTPFFSDVGRAISRAERKYMHNRLGKYIRGADDTISISEPDFNILSKHIIKLLENDIKPNVMLAPIQIFSKFVKECWSKLAESNWDTNIIKIAGCDIQIVWSHMYAPLRSFIIFDSSSGIWHGVQDTELQKGITVAIGESKSDRNQMVYVAETMAYYEILNRDAFTRINLSY